MTSSRAGEAPPRTLSHYTTLEGLKGIVEARRLWASNASFLNDKAELSHALQAAKLAIGQLSSKRSMTPMVHVAETGNGRIRSRRRARYVCRLLLPQ